MHNGVENGILFFSLWWRGRGGWRGFGGGVGFCVVVLGVVREGDWGGGGGFGKGGWG